MFRFPLVIFLVAVTASASEKHVKKTRRELCSGRTHPHNQCSMETSDDYPTLYPLQRTINIADAKKLLKEAHSFENLCSEGKRLYNCYSSSLDTATEECREKWKGDLPSLETTLYFIDELCTEDNFVVARQNFDCLTNEDRLATTIECFRKNWNIDCSGSTDHLYRSREECWNKKYSPNCDVGEVIKCVVEKVGKPCGEDAEGLSTLFATAYFHMFPLC